MILFLWRWFLLVVLNLLAGGLALIWTLRWAPVDDDVTDITSSWATLGLSLVIVLQTLLGIVGWLTPWHELFLLLGLGVISIPLCRHPRLQERAHQLCARAALILKGLWACSHAVTIAVLVFCVALAFLVGALAQPSTMFDSLAYHLPMVVEWFQQHRLTPFYLPWADLANSYFPGNGELLYLWLFAPLRSDLLVNVANLALWATLWLAFTYASRKVGVSTTMGVILAFIFVLTPVVLSQAIDQTLDVASVAFFLLAVGHLFKFGRSLEIWHITMFSLAAGLVLGTKYSGPAYVVMLGVALLLVMWWSRRSLAACHLPIVIGIVSAGTLLVGGWWYARNYIVAGNPVYPLEVSVLGRVLFPGVKMIVWDSTRLWHVLSQLPVLGTLALAAAKSYGAVFCMLALAAPASALYGWFSGHRKRANRDWLAIRTLILLSTLTLGALVLYLKTPYSVMRFDAETSITTSILAAGMRFSLVLTAVWGLAMALMLDTQNLSARHLWLMVGIALLQAVLAAYDRNIVGFFARGLYTPTYLWAIAAVVTSFLLLPAFVRGPACVTPTWSHSLRKSAVILISVATLLVSGYGAYRVDRYRDRSRVDVYRREYGEIADGWAWLWDHVAESKIAYSGLFLIYPLYGRDMTNTVRYVNIAGELDWRHHDFTGQGRYYRDGSSSFESWRRNLAKWGAEYWVLSGEPNVTEVTWVAEHPDLFEPVFISNGFAVYRILPDSPQ